MTVPAHAVVDEETPGVDVVLPVTDPRLLSALVPTGGRELLGHLHRRSSKRRRDVLASASGPTSSQPDDASFAVRPFEAPRELRVVTPATPGGSWQERLEALASTLRSVVDLSSAPVVRRSQPCVVVRDWGTDEPAILVDGRPVPAPILDIGLTIHHLGDAIRAGETPVWYRLPPIESSGCARLWAELLRLAEDKIGAARGSLRVVVTVGDADGLDRLDATLDVLRDHAAGVAVSEDVALDETEVKSVAQRRGAIYCGVLERTSRATTDTWD